MAMDKITTPEFRVSFPNVFKPTAFENQEPKFGITMLFPKNADLSGLKKLAGAAIAAKWPDKAKRPAGLRNPFRDGDTEKPDTEGYSGCIFVRATSKMKPGVVDASVNPIMSEEEFYAGCYARATLTAYAYDTAGNRGVAFGLQNVQKLREGAPFSGRSKPEDDFEAVETDDFLDSSGAVETTDDMFG